MSGADRLRAQAGRAASRRAPREPVFEDHPDQTSLIDAPASENLGAPAPTPAPAATPRRRTSTPRTKPVRITVDLAPLPYRALTKWCQNAADDLGLPRVPAAVVVRSLLAELDGNPALTQAIRDRIVKGTDSQ